LIAHGDVISNPIINALGMRELNDVTGNNKLKI
jgi:hypothetical protein